MINSNSPSAAATFMEESNHHQQQLALAAMILEQQQRPSSAHSSGPTQQQQMAQMQPLSSRKLFIGGLGQINDDTLRQYYAQWGQVVDCIVIRDPATRSSRGFGFVTYATAEMADTAMANRPHIISGKAVDAKRAVPREKMNLIMDSDTPPLFLSLETTPGCRLQLSGLNWEWHTLDTLRAHFEQFGTVEQLEMVAYPRGYGSLAFENQAAVDRCLAQGPVHSVNGHPVEIKLASADSLVYHQHPKEGDRPNSAGSAISGSEHSSANDFTAHQQPLELEKTKEGGEIADSATEPEYQSRVESNASSAASGGAALL